jgi:hypothetical protein
MTDNSRMRPDSRSLAHLIDLFLLKGATMNHDPDREAVILMNHGHALEVSSARSTEARSRCDT